MPETAIAAPDWARASGDIWARRWQDTDAGLAGLAPYLLAAVLARAPAGPFTAFEIGCGPGTTALEVAAARADAAIVACDISPSLAAIARQRLTVRPAARVVAGDAEVIAETEGPFDLIYSRHGVMFFDEPVRAFGALRRAARPGASLVFSCFRDWELNPWASTLTSAAVGGAVPAPGREPGGFAFAEPDHVGRILNSSGWTVADPRAVDFRYVAGEGEDAVDHALSFMAELGPAARVIEGLDQEVKRAALQRMRAVIERQFDGTAVGFPAAAWIWSAIAA